MAPSRSTPAQSLPVLSAEHILATDGANMGDALSFASELVLDDVYEVTFGAEPQRLSVVLSDAGDFSLAQDTEIGTPGAQLHLDSALSFMSPDGMTHDTLLLVEVDDEGSVADIYLLPLTGLGAGTEYRLVGVDTQDALKKFAQVGCVSFTHGTQITLASGEQRLIQDLKVGDRVLTRDDGVQVIRWIGQSTVRATGEFAPVKIQAGTLHNAEDLIVSPDHRLFIYQRSDEVGAGRSELLVKARHLVNGYTVTVMDGGFVEYYQLLFDRHQIIYAEGIAAETMLVDTRTKPVLPPEISKAMGDAILGHSNRPHADLDVSEALLQRPDVAALLRKASAG